MFNFNVNQSKKAIFVTVEGYFSESDALAYLAEYQKTVKSVVPSQYILVVDGRGQKTTAQDVVAEMQQAVDMYLSSGFKKVFIVNPSSPTAKMQVKRLRDYDKVNFIDTPEEALQLA